MIMMTKYLSFALSRVVLLLLCCPNGINGVDAANEDLVVIPQDLLQSLLPPSPPWDTSLVDTHLLSTTDPFVTPAETSNFMETATYEEVTDFYNLLAERSSYVQVKSLMRLSNNEDMLLVTVSGEQKFTPETMTKPILYVTGGLHGGENSGVNGVMMFVRNLVTDPSYKDILNAVNLLLIPVVDVTGYLRASENGRFTQYGPNQSGRRANNNWYNLNRDFTKLDALETRAVLQVMTDYDISFYLDFHDTDGMNAQTDVTYCDNGDSGVAINIYNWLRNELNDDLHTFLKQYNHIPGPCFDANDVMDPMAGYYPYFTESQYFSTNYADNRQIPAYLVEMHSLKPNKQRVMGTYSMVYGIMTLMMNKADSLAQAISADRAARVDPVPVAYDYNDPVPIVDWPVFEWEVVTNEVLGIPQMIWTNISKTIQVEQSDRSVPLNAVARPVAYYIPAVWTEVIKRLEWHGIPYNALTEPITLEVVQYRIDDFEIDDTNREGHATAILGTAVPETRERTYLPNDVVVYTDQPLGTLAIALLEPSSEAGLFYWGFFNTKFQSHESPENYAMVPIALHLLENYPHVADAWEEYKVANPEYQNDTDAVLEFFFRQTVFYDEEAYVYPIGVSYNKEQESSGDRKEEDPKYSGDEDVDGGS